MRSTLGAALRSVTGVVTTTGIAIVLASTSRAQAPNSYEPKWNKNVAPNATLTVTYNTAATPAQNGQTLKAAIQALHAGDTLAIDPGPNPGVGTTAGGQQRSNYELPAGFEIFLQGTYTAPIAIRGVSLAVKPVITRAVGSTETVVTLGSSSQPARYLYLRGLDITGGGIGVAFKQSDNVWIEQCDIHNTGGGGIKGPISTPSQYAPSSLFLVNNEIHDTLTLGNSSYGEGIRLKAHHSVLAINHVHHTRNSTQGDGIQIESGSYANWIVGNVVHHTYYPCFYFIGDDGTHPNEPTKIEQNIAYNSLDNVFQYEDGDNTIVRNNLFVGPCGNKIYDSSHGSPENVQVIHNTFISGNGYCAGLKSWKNGGQGLVFANNACYSSAYNTSTYAISRDPLNTDGTPNTTGSFYGNVKVGNVHNIPISGYRQGNGLSDFVNFPTWTWYSNLDTKLVRVLVRDVMPSPSGKLVGAADVVWVTPRDLVRRLRDQGPAQAEAGCLELVNVP